MLNSGFQLQLIPSFFLFTGSAVLLTKFLRNGGEVEFRRLPSSEGCFLLRTTVLRPLRLADRAKTLPSTLTKCQESKMLEVRGASTQSGCKCFANSASSVNFFIHVLMSAECYGFFIRLTFLCHCCCCYCLQGCLCRLQRLKHIVIGKASHKDCVTNLLLR